MATNITDENVTSEVGLETENMEKEVQETENTTQEVGADTSPANGQGADDAATTAITTTVTAEEPKSVVTGDAEADEHDMISMPSANVVYSDLQSINRSRRVVIHTASVEDMASDVIREIMRNQVCDEITFHFINGTEETGMKGVISMTFSSVKQAAEYVPLLQSIRSDLVVQQAPSNEVTINLVSQWKKERGLANPTTESMLLVKNLDPATATVETLAALFPDAEDIVIASQPDASNKGKLKGRKHCYLLYKNPTESQAALERYAANPVELNGEPLIILRYKEPPKHIPEGYLSLTARKLVLRHIARFKGLLVRAQEDPLLEVKDGWAEGLKNSSELIDKDDVARDALGLPKPTLNDFKDMTNLKDLTGKQTDQLLIKLNLADKPISNDKGMHMRGKKRAANNDSNQQKKKAKDFSGNNRGASAGRGYQGQGGRGTNRGGARPVQYGFSTGVRPLSAGFSMDGSYRDSYNAGLSYGRVMGFPPGARPMNAGSVYNPHMASNMRGASRGAPRGNRGRGGWM